MPNAGRQIPQHPCKCNCIRSVVIRKCLTGQYKSQMEKNFIQYRPQKDGKQHASCKGKCISYLFSLLQHSDKCKQCCHTGDAKSGLISSHH